MSNDRLNQQDAPVASPSALTSSDNAIARLAAIVESSDDAIISKDLSGIIMSWNKGAERLFGYRAEEMIGKPVALLIPADRADEEPVILERLRRGDKIDHYETVRQRKDGSLVDISITVSPIRDASGRVVGAAKIARDITQRIQAEAALRDAVRRKNEFLAMLAHELRGPLAPVRNGLQIIRMHGGDAEAVAAAATIMERQLGQMARMIDDLIDVSRINQGKLELRREPTELTAIVRSVAEAAHLIERKRAHELRVSLPAEPIHVHADPIRVAQVLGNLVHNAFKFTPRGGRVEISAEKEGEWALIRVRDEGIGIAAGDLDRIFEMFEQVDSSLERSSGGLGIGLSLVKSIIEMHGGTVGVSSLGLGRGAEFVLRMPVLTAPMDGPMHEPARERVTAASKRVLVVDDNRDSAESLALLLSLDGHCVRTAFDGEEALESAAAHSGHRERSFRSIVNSDFGDRERSVATPGVQASS